MNIKQHYDHEWTTGKRFNFFRKIPTSIHYNIKEMRTKLKIIYIKNVILIFSIGIL